jgi:hypothetical protein
MSVFYRDACPGILLHVTEVDQHCPFALSESFGCVGLLTTVSFTSAYVLADFPDQVGHY